VSDSAQAGLTRTGLRLVLLITGLSVAHHVDHVIREVTGWPVDDEFNAFSASLFVYPVILFGLILSRQNRVGARFWAILAGGAAVFILVIHVGPAAADSVTTIPDQYASALAAVVALAVLVLFVAALVVHCFLELRRMRS
jgi:peptidoglycan/LPS O-acetylase OafA/YrhL